MFVSSTKYSSYSETNSKPLSSINAISQSNGGQLFNSLVINNPSSVIKSKPISVTISMSHTTISGVYWLLQQGLSIT